MKIHFTRIFFAFLVFYYPPTYSQDHQDNQEPLELFDQIVGIENTGLANGEEYIEPHIIRDDQHKYFLSSSFLKGQVTYDEQLYYPVLLKYNIFDDVLLVFLNTSDGNSTIKLHKNKITSFRVDAHTFINVNEDDAVNGFYEVLLDTNGSLLLKKHFKKVHKELDDNFTYYRFEEDDPAFVVSRNGNYFPVSSKRDFLKVFPEQGKKIKDFYSRNKSLRKNSPDQFMIRLLQTIKQL
ncbi:MAG: hypothetical protein R3209_04500 [Salinimicrobium sediminis]|nr:hypothetical protein [Salinimicrobium sediminis]